MNLAEKINKVKQKIKPYENDLILVFVIICVALIGFGLGRLSAISERKTPITIENTQSNVSAAATTTYDVVAYDVVAEEKLYVASKNGTKYHYPWCSGAQNIKEENKIWFSAKEEAEKAGYSPAANCKGL